MIELDNPPPPFGANSDRGEWDRNGVAPRWRNYKWYEHRPWWQWIVGLFTIIGAFAGLLQVMA